MRSALLVISLANNASATPPPPLIPDKKKPRVATVHLKNTMFFHPLLLLVGLSAVQSYRMDLNFDLQANTLLEVPFIMYGKLDSPSTGPPGNGVSKIVLDIHASTVVKNALGVNGQVLVAEPKIEVVVLEKQDLPKVGGIGDNNERLLCCTEAVRQKYEIDCNIDQMFTAAKPTGVFQVQSFVLGANDSNVPVHLEFPTNATTVYYLLMSTCEHDKATLKGYVTALNPYGWLPAQYYRELPFYQTMLIMYCTAGLVWLYLCIKHRSEVVQVHTWFSLLLGIAIFDTLLKYIDVSDVRPRMLLFELLCSAWQDQVPTHTTTHLLTCCVAWVPAFLFLGLLLEQHG